MDHRSRAPSKPRAAALSGGLLPQARISWRDGLPFNDDFADVYHRRDGIGESRRLCIELHDLDARFGALSATEHFRIGELGFGTGLNCIVSVEHFLRAAPPSAFLHYTATELHPVTRMDLSRLVASRAEIAPWQQRLCDAYPPPISGWHRLRLHPRVAVSLYFGDSEAALSSLIDQRCLAMDAWFLDGFAPDRNPNMWSEALFALLGRLSHGGTTAASFSVAGRVRQALAGAGFRVRTVPGGPFKREHLRANAGTDTAKPSTPRPRVDIVGAGIAGLCVAESLCQRGSLVTLYDTNTFAVGGASAVPAAALHHRYPRTLTPAGRMRLKSLFMSAAYYRALDYREVGEQGARGGWHGSGVLNLFPSRDQPALATWVELLPEWFITARAPERSAHFGSVGPLVPAGLPAGARTGVLLPDLGFAELGVLCAGLRRSQRIVAPATALSVEPSQRITVIASPEATNLRLSEPRSGDLAHLSNPLRPSYGTVTTFALRHQLRGLLSGYGYVAPLDEETVAVGGTYERPNPWPDAQSERANRERLEWFFSGSDARPIAQFRARRWNTLDRLPIIGATSTVHLYFATAYASAGLSWAPLAAEHIASMLYAEAPVFDDDESRAVDPRRFGF